MKEEIKKYPFLDTLYKKKIFLFIDCFFALKFLKNKDEDSILAMSFLFAAARNGHLCIKIKEGNQVFPNPLFLLFDEKELIPLFKEKVIKGLLSLDDEIVERTPSNKLSGKPVYFLQDSYYLHRNYIFEERIVEAFSKIYEDSPSIRFTDDEIEKKLIGYKGSLLPHQKEAIEKSIKNSVSFIFGGPGTGKTYTAGMLIEIFSGMIHEKAKVILTAPTGKASLNLEEKIQKREGSFSKVDIASYTLHSLLKINSNKPAREIDADLIIVDEASMIDARIMGILFSSIKKGCRLVMIGDPYQLPPIETGNLFSVFLNLKIEKCSTVLQRCMRNENIIMNEIAEAIKNGKEDAALTLLKKGDENIRYSEAGDKSAYILTDILKKADKYYLPFSFKEIPPDILYKKFIEFKILTSLKIGFLGVDYLNKYIYEHILSKTNDNEYLAYPIMITKNNYNLNLFNGSLGVVIRRKVNDQVEENAFFFKEEVTGTTMQKIPLYMIGSYELSYVLSVHKSQGSEFDSVMLLLTNASSLFGRELLYTAITRTRRTLEIMGSDYIIKQIIKNKAEIQNNLFSKLAFID